MAIFDHKNMPPVTEDWNGEAALPPRRQSRRKEAAKYVAWMGLAAAMLTAGVEATIRQDGVPQGGGKSQPWPKPSKHLPPAVEREIGSVVKVFDGNKSEGSGVKIGPRSILTAGHMITDKTRLSLHKSCDGLTIEDANTRAPGGEVFAISKAGQHKGPPGRDSVSANDLALLHVTSNRAFRDLPSAPLGRQPSVGGPVYFVNYEAAPRHEERFPNASLAYSDTGFYAPKSKRIAAPAMYAGTVLGQDGHDLVVATGQRGYNRPGASFVVNSFPGASGGPVFDAAGDVFGLSVALGNPPEETVAEVAKDWHIRLALPLQQRVGISYVQPVTRELTNRYQHVLDGGPSCAAKPDPIADMVG